MPAATIWNRITNFLGYATANPSATYPPALIDQEFDAARLTVQELRTNIALIQRDDGRLKNGSVHPDSLSAATRVLISDWNPRGDWVTATVYALKDVVEEDGVWYVCIVAHTSGASFAVDLAAARWMAINLDMAALAATSGTPIVNDAMVAVQLDATGAVARTQHRKNAEIVSVTDFYANGVSGVAVDPTGVVDSTLGIQAAIDYLEDSTATRGRLYFPTGTYLVTGQLRISNDRINLFGDGPQSSRIDFRPTATATCFLFQKATAAQIVQCSIKGIGMISGGGNTQTKTALNVVDANLFVCEDFAVNSWAGSSIGIKTNGRDASYFSRIAINCLRPLLISTNPNYAPIDIDHFEFNDLYLTTTAKAVEIESGVDLSNVKFTGTQAWVAGTYGLYWVSTSATGISYPLSIENLRTEQGDTGYWPIYIDLSAAQLLRSFSLSDSFLGNENGIYLRNVSNISLRNVSTGGGSGKAALDITAQARSLLVCENVQIQDSATVTLTTFTRLFESMPTSTNSPLGEYAVYCYNGNSPLMRHTLLASASLPAALAGRSGGLVLEDAGRGHIEAVVYGNAERHRVGMAISKRVQFFDDFLGDVLADQWGTQIGSDPQCVAAAAVAITNGVCRMTTGDDAAGTMAVNGTQLHAALQWRASQDGFSVEFKIQISAITDIAVFIGITDQVAALEMPIHGSGVGNALTNNATDAVGVLFDTVMTDDNWWLVGVANNVGATAQNTAGAPVAATYETWRIEVATNNSATFYRNGVAVGTAVTGAITANTLCTPVIAAFSRGAASRNIQTDYIEVACNRTT